MQLGVEAEHQHRWLSPTARMSPVRGPRHGHRIRRPAGITRSHEVLDPRRQGVRHRVHANYPPTLRREITSAFEILTPVDSVNTP
jgi:hypothetical protein